MDAILDGIPGVILLLYLRAYQRRNRSHVGPVTLLIGVYVIMCALSLFLEFYRGNVGVYDLQVVPVSYLAACLVIALWGSWGHRDYHLVEIHIESLWLLRSLEAALLVFSLAGMAFFWPFAVAGLTGDIGVSRQTLSHLDVMWSWGLVNSFFSLIANMFGLNIMLGLMNLCPPLGRTNWSVVRAIALLFSSTIYIVYVLAYVGRDGFVFWVLTAAFAYLLLKDFMPRRNRVFAKQVALLVSIVAAVPFGVITQYRSESISKAGTLDGVLLYGGAQIRQFNDQFLVLAQPQWGQMNFPAVYNTFARLFAFPLTEFERFRAEWFRLYTSMGVAPWTFSTFVGAFLYDFGYYVTPLVVLVIALISRSSLKASVRDGRMSVSALLMFLVCSQIVLFGVFYFRQYAANTYLIAVVVLSGAFKLLGKGSGGVVIAKTTGGSTA